jgi:hypothetical protein
VLRIAPKFPGRTILILRALYAFGVLGIALFHPLALDAQVAVRHTEGLIHGFLELSTLDGEILADGEQTQIARGDQVTTHLVFRFKDGSVHEETTVFSQRQNFKLINASLVQKGPAFKVPMEFSVSATSGQVMVTYTDEHGDQKTLSEHLELPADVYNGMISTLIKNLPAKNASTTVHVVAAGSKPQLVKVEIDPVGEDSFFVGRLRRVQAMQYAVKVDLSAVTGLIASIVGKRPQETHIWVLQGKAPAFFRSEGPLYHGGPIWRIELVSPRWGTEQRKNN